MRRAGTILRKLLYPPNVILCVVPPAAFAALIFIFAAGKQESTAAYFVYFVSAYSLAISLAAVPRLAKRAKAAIMNSKPARKLLATKVGGRYLRDTAFRGSVSIWRGMAANFGHPKEGDTWNELKASISRQPPGWMRRFWSCWSKRTWRTSR